MSGRVRIGVFDSGVGGLTVLNRLTSRLPNASYDYLGDTARVPYGSRSTQTIIDFSHECLSYLAGRGADLLVIACNTSSAVALPYLQTTYGIPVVGVIEDGIAVALEASTERVLVLGTRATIVSGIYQSRIRQARPSLQARGLACPLFVPIVEEGWAISPVAIATARVYLSECADYPFDLMLLGCTHFPVMYETLRHVVGDDVRIEDPGARLVGRIADMFPQASGSAIAEVNFHVTDSPDGFVRVARAMGFRVTDDVKHVDLNKLEDRSRIFRSSLAAESPAARDMRNNIS